jgi:hypothetical protein
MGRIMSNLQIKRIDDGLYAEIKKMASEERRSVSQQILYLAKDYLARKKNLKGSKTAAQVLLELSGSWIDERKSEEIIKEIRGARSRSKKPRSRLF